MDPEYVKKHCDADGWYIPVLNFTAEDLSCKGCTRFLSTTNCPKLLHDAILAVLKRLYVTSDKQPLRHKTISLYVRPMEGVAYTVDEQLHFSSDYIAQIDPARVREEILGVIRHEMVHAWQYNANDTAPSGLIEGIADWVRLKDGFIPPHWHRRGKTWDSGYQNTAYFLEWLEETYGEGTVVWINEQLKDKDYCDTMWQELSGGKTIEALWTSYAKRYNIPVEEEEDCTDSQTMVEVEVVSSMNSERPSGGSRHVESIADSNTTDSTFEPFPFRGEATLSEVFANRLKKHRFDGIKDGSRFIKEFEQLIARVSSDVSEDDKKLLLTTCFDGPGVHDWYEALDFNDDMPYPNLVEEFKKRWTGLGSRTLVGDGFQ